MMIECTIDEFNFDLEGSLEPKICDLLKVEVGTKTADLNEMQYNEVCDAYDVPRRAESFIIDADADEDTSLTAVNSELSEYFGWMITRFDFALIN